MVSEFKIDPFIVDPVLREALVKQLLAEDRARGLFMSSEIKIEPMNVVDNSIWAEAPVYDDDDDDDDDAPERRPPPPVLVDCDGVLANWIDGAKRTVIEIGGPDAWTNDYFQSWGFMWNGTLPKAIQEEVDAQLNDPKWWARLEALPGARLAWTKLVSVAGQENCRVITAPSDYCLGWSDARKHWLSTEIGVSSRQVTIGGDKHLWVGDGIFFEDRVDTLVRWLDRGNFPGARLGICVKNESFNAQLGRLTKEELEHWAEYVLDGSLFVVDSFEAGVNLLIGEGGARRDEDGDSLLETFT